MNKGLTKSLFQIVLPVLLLIAPAFAFEVELSTGLTHGFPGLEDVYSELHFNRDGNDFFGVIFWLGTEDLDDPEPINLEASADELECNKQIKGLYFNSQRGGAAWPMDQESLDTLKSISSDYSGLVLTGGWYMDCDGQDEEEVYGQIEHTLNDVSYKLVGGVEIDGNEYNQEFDNSLLYYESDDRAEGYIFDSLGGVAEVFQEVGGTPDEFSFPIIRNAGRDEYYISDEIEIDGLGDGVKSVASVSKGVLFINGDPVGSTGYVEDGDELQIEMKSSDDYDSITSSTLTIGSESASFYVITREKNMENECEVSDSEKLRIHSVFDILMGAYKEDPSKEEAFLYTFKSMLEDRVDMDDDECSSYSYLLDITEAYILNDIDVGIDDLPVNTHVAPNCKVYGINYDSDRQAYYSPDFVIQHYFISRESLTAFVDENNPGNATCEQSNNNDPEDRDTRTAPNGKIYRIVKDGNKYTSSDFRYAKSFDSVSAIRKYIDMQNPKIEVWNHTVDDTFEPVIYYAPNGKEYKIQKVNKDGAEKYMSYKFIFVKYFDSMEAIKAYIDKNNPK